MNRSLRQPGIWNGSIVVLLSALLLSPVASPLATAALLHVLSQSLPTAVPGTAATTPAAPHPVDDNRAATGTPALPRRATDEEEALRRAAGIGLAQRRADRWNDDPDQVTASHHAATIAAVASALVAVLFAPANAALPAPPTFPVASPASVLPIAALRSSDAPALASPRAPPLA